MPTTPTFGLRYPAPIDPADVPLDIQELATDVETNLSTVQAIANGAVPKAVIDAAEDLIVGAGPDAVKRLAKGADGQILTVQAGVLAYATPAGAGQEFDYKQITADVTGISQTTEATAATVIASNTVTYDGSRVRVEFFCPGLETTGQIGLITFLLLRDTTVIGQALSSMGTGSNRLPPSPLVAFDTPTPGNHSYTVKVFVNTQTLTVKAGPGGAAQLLPAFLRVTRA